MRPLVEVGVLAVNRIIQAIGGPVAEPLATIVARPLLQTTHRGERVVLRSGLRWQIDLSNNLERRLYFVRSYERATVQEANGVYGQETSYWTLGRISVRSPYRSRGVTVVAVEPASDTANRLRAHVNMNDLTNRVHVIQAALGKEGLRSICEWDRKSHTGLRTLAGAGNVIEKVEQYLATSCFKTSVLRQPSSR